MCWTHLRGLRFLLSLNTYTYGCKSAAAYFLFLDDINREAVVELDVSYYIQSSAGFIKLVKPKSDAEFPEGIFGNVGIAPAKKIGETFGTFGWAAFPDADGPNRKVKIYSGLVHCLKSFRRETSFGTLPKTGKMFKSRLSQGREFLN